jgi:hypothetical protein
MQHSANHFVHSALPVACLATVAASLVAPHPVMSSGVNHSRSSTPSTTEKNHERPLWQLVVEHLPEKDPETEWYNLQEIAPLVGITPRSLSKHCRDLWPGWEGHYRLKYSQAISLIRRVCYAGRKLPPRSHFEREIENPGGDAE